VTPSPGITDNQPDIADNR